MKAYTHAQTQMHTRPHTLHPRRSGATALFELKTGKRQSMLKGCNHQNFICTRAHVHTHTHTHTRTLRSIYRSGNTTLFELETGRKQGVLKGHKAEVSALCWKGAAAAAAGGDARLFSGDCDGEVRVWDVRKPPEARQVAVLQGAR